MPKGFTIFGFEIKFYGVLMAIAYIVALFMCMLLCKKKKYSDNLPYILILIIFPLAVLGGRIYYALFSGVNWTFLQFIDIRSGGLGVLGGVILSAVGVVIYSLIKKENPLKYLDLIAPCLILGQSIGRIGCLIEGCCYGIEITNESLMWFPFAQQIDSHWYLSTQLFESVLCLIGFFIIYNSYKNSERLGLSTFLYLFIYGVIRVFLEAFRADEQSLKIGTFRVSQIMSIIMIVLGLAYLIYLYFVVRKENKIKRQKYEESHIFEETATQLENLSYSIPKQEVKQEEQVAQEVKLNRAQKVLKSREEKKQMNIKKKK